MESRKYSQTVILPEPSREGSVKFVTKSGHALSNSIVSHYHRVRV
jgi:hypothetical protein